MAPEITQIASGFSLTNRCLMYTSLILTPAQSIVGLGRKWPSNVGFMAYNWYLQYVWCSAVQAKQLHALSLVPVHLNMIYAVTYLGGITSGNMLIAVLLLLSTQGLILFNTVFALICCVNNQREGLGVYQFFFFGWHTLSHGWYLFFIMWQIGDILLALSTMFIAVRLSSLIDNFEEGDQPDFRWKCWSIALGSVIMLLLIWPLVLWTELIIYRNHIESPNDPIQIWLFVAQVAALLVPSCSPDHSLHGWKQMRERIAIWRSSKSDRSPSLLKMAHPSQQTDFDSSASSEVSTATSSEVSTATSRWEIGIAA